MRKRIVFATVLALLGSAVCAAEWTSWHSYGPELPQAGIDVIYTSSVSLVADPVTGYPHLAFFYNWGGTQWAPRTWVVCYSTYDGSSWSTQFVQALQEVYDDDDVDDDIIFTPGTISLALEYDGVTSTVFGGIAYSFFQDNDPGGFFSSHIYYVPIDDGVLGTLEDVMTGAPADNNNPVMVWGPPNDDWWAADYLHGSAHVVSLQFLNDATPFIAFSSNSCKHIIEFSFYCWGQLCWRTKPVGLNWQGSTWLGGGGGFSPYIRNVTGYTAIADLMGIPDVCLQVDRTDAPGFEPRIAYSVYSGNQAEREVSYAYQYPVLNSWTSETVDSNFLHDEDCRHSINVSLALNGSNEPVVAYEAGGIYAKACSGGVWPAVPEAVDVSSVWEGDDRMLRLGGIAWDGTCGGLWVSVADIALYDVDAGKVLAYYKEPTQWTLNYVVAHIWKAVSKDWRPVIDTCPVFGSPLVATSSSSEVTVVGHVNVNPAIHVYVAEADTPSPGTPIDDATVRLLIPPLSIPPDSEFVGEYRFIRRPPGSYQVSISHPDYTPNPVIVNVNVTCGQCSYVRVELEPVKEGCGAAPIQRQGAAARRALFAFMPLALAAGALLIGCAIRRRKRGCAKSS